MKQSQPSRGEIACGDRKAWDCQSKLDYI